MSDNVQKIAVLGSSTMSNDTFSDEGRALGNMLAQQGLTVVLPGDLDSVQGDVSLGALYEEGKVVNVYSDPGAAPFAPHPPNLNDELVERVMVDGRKGVKKSLDTRADVAVLLPGGLEELDQAMHLARRGMPLVIVESSGFYAGLNEQISAIKENSEAHGVPWDHLAHVHVVGDVEEVMPIIDLYNAKGTPENDYAQRYSQAKAEDRVVKLEREGNKPGFTYRDKQFILSTDAGIMALDRASSALADEPNVPMEIDNSTGYYDGLIAQFETYVDEGAEKPNFLSNLRVIGSGSDIAADYSHIDDDFGASEHTL